MPTNVGPAASHHGLRDVGSHSWRYEYPDADHDHSRVCRVVNSAVASIEPSDSDERILRGR